MSTWTVTGLADVAVHAGAPRRGCLVQPTPSSISRRRWSSQPDDVPTLAAMLRWADDEKLAVVPRGAGTKRRWGAVPTRVDIVLSLSRTDDADRTLCRRSDRHPPGRRDARRGQRGPRPRAAVAAARSARRRSLHDRRHARHQRQRSAALEIRRATRSGHRRRDGARRRPRGEGGRQGREKRRRLRSRPPALRIVRSAGRDDARDLQAGAAAARLAHGRRDGRRRARGRRTGAGDRRDAALTFRDRARRPAISGAPADPVRDDRRGGGRAGGAPAPGVRATRRARPRCSPPTRKSDLVGLRRGVDGQRATRLLKAVVLPTEVGRLRRARRSGGRPAVRSAGRVSGCAALGVLYCKLIGP